MTFKYDGNYKFLNQYSDFWDNSYLEEKVGEYVEKATSIDVLELYDYLYSFRGNDGININMIPGQDKYNFRNFMYILENCLNYILTLRNLVYKDFKMNESNQEYYPLIEGLNQRCAIIMAIYRKEQAIHNKKYGIRNTVYKEDENKKINIVDFNTYIHDSYVKTYSRERRTYSFGTYK